jgi:hypothetical protein
MSRLDDDLAAVSEGFCPEHLTRLESQEQGGWCPDCGYCGVWYTADFAERTVTATYALVTAGW